MLKCREFVHRTDALLDGELDWRARLSCRVHILICHHCRRYVRQLGHLLRAIPRMHGRASDAEVEQVIRRIHEEQ